MLDQLDNALRQLFLDQVPGLTSETQVRFQPPDDDWRTAVTNLNRNALNVYLMDLRENRKLRSNEWIDVPQNGFTSHEPPPGRVDCHYLITAWSPAAVTPPVEPTIDEHLLLYQALAVLMASAPINPSRIYPPGSAALAAVDPLIRDADLPTQVVPSDGFAKLAEFWGAMGANDRWKPAVYLVVTMPVALRADVTGPLVTTRIIEFRQSGRPETAEVWIQIGGTVRDPAGGPVPGAWVALETPAGAPLQTAEANGVGRFTFGALRASSYRLRARANGFAEVARVLSVPTESGEYDLRFS